MLSYLCTGSEDFYANPDTDYQTKNGKDEFYSEVDQALWHSNNASSSYLERRFDSWSQKEVIWCRD